MTNDPVLIAYTVKDRAAREEGALAAHWDRLPA